MHSEGRYGLETGLVGWWRLFDSNEGVNDIISTNNGTLNGGMGYISSGGRRYAVFDGSNDYVSTPIVPSSAIGNGNPFTITAWLYRNSGGTPDFAVIGSVSAGPTRFYLAIDIASNRPYCGTGSGATTFTTVTMPTNQWHHVALTYDGTNFRFYKDGVLAETKANGGSNSYSTAAFSIGANNDIPGGGHNGFYYGNISDVRLYNRAISAAEAGRLARVY